MPTACFCGEIRKHIPEIASYLELCHNNSYTVLDVDDDDDDDDDNDDEMLHILKMML